MGKRNKTSLPYPTCPYCGQKSMLLTEHQLFGNRANSKDKNEKYFVCKNYPKCDTYIRAEKRRKTYKPTGAMANKELRRKRMEAHSYFDLLWQRDFMPRASAYKWLEAILGLQIDSNGILNKYAHFGELRDYQCDFVIAKVKEFLKNNNVFTKTA